MRSTNCRKSGHKSSGRAGCYQPFANPFPDSEHRGPSQYAIFEMTTNDEDDRARLRRFAHGTLAEFLGYWHEMKLPE